MLALTAALLFGYTDAASYNFSIKWFSFDHATDHDDVQAVYLTVGGHKANGELIEAANTNHTDDSGGNLVPHFGYIFNDTDDAVYNQWFLTLHAITNTTTGEEYIFGYANNFIEIPSTICDHDSSYTFGFQDIWQGTWDAIGTVSWELDLLEGCDETSTTTSLAPYNEEDATEEACYFISYRMFDCNEDPGTLTFHREYFGYAPSKCGDQILRTETFGARECGHDGLFPDSIGNHTCLVLPCEYGQFRVHDGVYRHQMAMVVLMGVTAVMLH